jgi:hypothetical protein
MDVLPLKGLPSRGDEAERVRRSLLISPAGIMKRTLTRIGPAQCSGDLSHGLFITASTFFSDASTEYSMSKNRFLEPFRYLEFSRWHVTDHSGWSCRECRRTIADAYLLESLVVFKSQTPNILVITTQSFHIRP